MCRTPTHIVSMFTVQESNQTDVGNRCEILSGEQSGWSTAVVYPSQREWQWYSRFTALYHCEIAYLYLPQLLCTTSSSSHWYCLGRLCTTADMLTSAEDKVEYSKCRYASSLHISHFPCPPLMFLIILGIDYWRQSRRRKTWLKRYDFITIFIDSSWMKVTERSSCT